MVKEWDTALIGDIFDFKNGLNKGKEFFGYGTPLVNYTDVYKKRALKRTDLKGRVSLGKDEIRRFEARRNDVFFTRTSETPDEVGMTSVLLDDIHDCVFSGFVLRARPKNDTLIPEYCQYCFSTKEIRSAIINGCTYTTRALTNGKQLSAIEIMVPEKSEQFRIAEALSDVDSMISSLEKLITKKKAVKQGVMQELLTGKIRLNGFVGEWKTEQLGNVSRIKTGDKNNEQKVDNGKYPFFVRSQQVERINTYSFDGEAILVPGEGNIGQIFHYINGKFDWHQRVYKISNFPDGVCGKYVYYQMKYCFGEHALRNTVKATVDSLRLPTFESFTFLLPSSFDEQVAISCVLSDLDREIEVLEQKLAKTRQLKQGMMQQLLTGKIRLVAEENATFAIPIAEQTDLPRSRSGHNQQFDDAVMIAAIVNAFYSDKYPLGRKKVQKLLYLLRRKQEEDISAFKKKAAGPYADEVRYKGGEPIAKRQGYIATATTQKGTSFSKGQAIDVALNYIGKWQMQSDIDWLVSTFKYTKTNDLELYATIDMAICDLQHEGIAVSVDSVKDLIRSNKEWKEKLTKTYFSDEDIARAIAMCKRLYS